MITHAESLILRFSKGYGLIRVPLTGLSVGRSSRLNRYTAFSMRALRVAHREVAALVRARARVFALLVHRIRVRSKYGGPCRRAGASHGHREHALHHLDQRLLGRHPLAHELHGQERAADFYVRFAASRGSGGAHVIVSSGHCQRPMIGESPTRPGIFHDRPLVVVTDAISPAAFTAFMLIVPHV